MYHGLSGEGRSSATTMLTLSALRYLYEQDQQLSAEAKKVAETEALSKLDRFQAELIQRGGPLANAAKQAALDNFALSALSQG